jgi:HAD superfamily hydrolase (TIGR01509 family)
VKTGVVFDFDGLILDTETPEYETWQKVFSARGATLGLQTWSQAVGGGPLVWNVETYLESLVPGIDLAEAREEFEAYRDAYLPSLLPLPGVVDLVRGLAEAGIPVGVASSSRRVWLERLLPQTGLQPYLQTVRTRDDARPKPDPDLYLLACADLGVDPSRSVAIEDSPNGMKAAKAAGMKVICCPNPITSHYDLSLADWRVETLAQVTASELSAWTRP